MLTVLLTGATGFVGGAVAARLLSDPRACRLILLVRGENERAARERARRSIARFTGATDAAADRIEIVVGDLADGHWAADPRLDRVTHVVHAAACTSFRSLREVHRTNVGGTLALANRMRHVPSLQRFVHVSTAYCCGAHPSPIVREDDPPPAEHDHVVEYTRTKRICEHALATEYSELPIVVARPSVVVGHSRLGCAPSSSLFWYYRTLARLGRTPFAPTSRRDIVPVDYVADALCFLLFLSRPRHRVYHVSAGEQGSVAWSDLVPQFARAGEADREPIQVAPDAIAEPPEVLASILLPEQDRSRFLGVLTACARFGALGIEWFDNARLLAEGFPSPPLFSEYLPLCLDGIRGRTVYAQMLDDD